jgi:hypothetical protein
LSHPVLRRVLPGAAASALGDGMSAVAIAWLALKLAPPGSRGLWVGAAVAAYSLPGAAGAVALRRWLRHRRGAWLVFVNAVLRAVTLGLIGCLVIAARSSLLILASPLGTALGGPIVAALGARGTLLASALTTIALALITAAVLVAAPAPAARHRTARPRGLMTGPGPPARHGPPQPLSPAALRARPVRRP